MAASEISSSSSSKTPYHALIPAHDQHDFVLDGSVDFRSRPALRSRTGGWTACFFIIGYELVERTTYYGIASNLVTYLTEELHEGTASASKNVNNWTGVTTVLPIVGAFIADAYLGRYLTTALLSICYVLGMIMLTLSASVEALKPSSCTSDTICPEATTGQLAFFFSSLYLIAIGTGVVKPCLEAFGADQFDEEDPAENKKKSSFFNWWYFGLCTGALLAFTVIVYIEDNASWGLAFGILTVLITIVSLIFLAGTPLYRNKLPGGSPLARIFQVFVAAARKWNVTVPHDDKLLYEFYDTESQRIGRRQLLHTNGLRCLDKAATKDSSIETLWQHEGPEVEDVKQSLVISDLSAALPVTDMSETRTSPWRLCTVTQVEEVKLIVRILPIWLCTSIYGLVIAQATTFFVEQAGTLDRSLGSFTIPSASLLTFSSIAVLIVLPIYDCIFVPIARLVTGCERGLTLLQRLGVGLFLAIICMVCAALVEMRRLQVALDNGLLDDSSVTLPMSIFWLVPQYIILGVSDVFALVGQQEFFYDQVPDTMRSLGMALYLCANGLGSFLSSILITVVEYLTSRGGNQSWIVDNLNRCHLDYFYWLLAILSTLNLCVYITLAWFYTYKTVEIAPRKLESDKDDF